MAFFVLWTFNAHVATLNLRTISLWAGHKLFSFWSMSGALKKDGTPHDLQIWFSHSKAKNPNCPLFMHKCPCVSFLFIVFSMVWLVTLFFFFVLFCFFFEATSHWLYCGVHPCNDALASVHRHTSLQQSRIGTCLCNETVSASIFLLQSCCLDAFMLHLKDLMRYGSYSLFKISIICIITRYKTHKTRTRSIFH